MSQPNTSSPKGGTLLTLTADDFSSAIGAALRAADTHTGKPAGKKQVALNAAAKAMSGPRANWGALKGKDKVATQAARTHASYGHSLATQELDVSNYQPLPDSVTYDEFGLHCFALEGEAKLRNSFAPVFAKGVHVVQIRLQNTRVGRHGTGDLTIDGPPAFLDRSFAPVAGIDHHDHGLALHAVQFVRKYEDPKYNWKLEEIIGRHTDIGAPIIMNITEIGVIFVSSPWLSSFVTVFAEGSESDLMHSKTVRRTYANIRAMFGPTKTELDVDEDMKWRIQHNALSIRWFLDPNLQAGPPDTDLLYDLVFRELSKSYWEDAKSKDQSIMELLQFIGQKAKEPRQERFPEFVFKQRHWNPDWQPDTTESLRHSTQQALDRTGGLIAQVGRLLGSGKIRQ